MRLNLYLPELQTQFSIFGVQVTISWQLWLFNFILNTFISKFEKSVTNLVSPQISQILLLSSNPNDNHTNLHLWEWETTYMWHIKQSQKLMSEWVVDWSSNDLFWMKFFFFFRNASFYNQCFFCALCDFGTFITWVCP